jgi:hypothetical protein
VKNKRIVLLSAIILAAPCTARATIINGICYGNPSPSVPSGTFDPNDPSGSGYSLVFDSEFNNFNDFDLSCNAAPTNGGCVNPPGKNWYLDAWTYPPTANTTNAATDLAILDGVLSIRQTIKTGNWAISTMAPHSGASHGPAAWQQNWNGEVFTGGWYVEARLSNEYTDTKGNVVPAPGASRGHAAFWAYATDHFNNSNPGGLWPSRGSNYIHFIENDMLDGIQGRDFYQTNLIDWFGTNNTPVQAVGTGMNIYGQVNVSQFGFPIGATFVNKTSFNVFGQLWIPATSTTHGYIQNYLDGVPTSRFSWNQYNPNTPPPATGSNIANMVDQDHMSIILGADPPNTVNGVQDPRVTMFVDWVHVWQLPAARAASGNKVISPQTNFTGGNGSCTGAFSDRATRPGPHLDLIRQHKRQFHQRSEEPRPSFNDHRRSHRRRIQR